MYRHIRQLNFISPQCQLSSYREELNVCEKQGWNIRVLLELIFW
jgi:hypothetical protein